MISSCENCGKEIRRTPSSLKRNNHHFCSGMCRVEFYKKQELKFSTKWKWFRKVKITNEKK